MFLKYNSVIIYLSSGLKKPYHVRSSVTYSENLIVVIHAMTANCFRFSSLKGTLQNFYYYLSLSKCSYNPDILANWRFVFSLTLTLSSPGGQPYAHASGQHGKFWPREYLLCFTTHTNTRICALNPARPPKKSVRLLPFSLCGVNYHHMLKILPMLRHDVLHISYFPVSQVRGSLWLGLACFDPDHPSLSHCLGGVWNVRCVWLYARASGHENKSLSSAFSQGPHMASSALSMWVCHAASHA